MHTTQWARLKADINCQLRRGAWYPIVRLAPADAVLDVKGRQVSIARSMLQLASAPPQHWTVVPSPRSYSPRYPASWGARYAVCPNCRDRAQLTGQPAQMRCHRCNGLFDVAWDEAYLVRC